MMAALRDYRAIWRVTALQRDAGWRKFLGMLALFLMTGGALIAATAAWQHKPVLELALRLLAGIVALVLTLCWAMLYVPGSLAMNSAMNARLLPRQRRRLMQMTVGGWLLTAAFLTAVFGQWAAFPLVATFVLGLALTAGGMAWGMFLTILPITWPMMARALPSAQLSALRLAPDVLGATACLLLLAGAGLRRLYSAGSDAHLSRHARQRERLQRGQRSQAWSQPVESGTAVGRGLLRIYGAALRRDCHPGPQGADPGTMLMHALGPAMHWSTWIAAVVAMLGTSIVIHLVMASWRAAPVLQVFVDAGSPGLAGFLSMVAFSTAQVGQAMEKTRGEQALLRLTPLTGVRRDLNLLLATQLLWRALATWITLSLTVMLSSVLLGGTGVLPSQAALCCVAGQIAMNGVLGDYAGEGGWRMGLALRAAAVALLIAGTAVGIGWLTHTSHWAWMALIAIAVAAFQLRQGWRRMLAAPPAFPARRFSMA